MYMYYVHVYRSILRFLFRFFTVLFFFLLFFFVRWFRKFVSLRKRLSKLFIGDDSRAAPQREARDKSGEKYRGEAEDATTR